MDQVLRSNKGNPSQEVPQQSACDAFYVAWFSTDLKQMGICIYIRTRDFSQKMASSYVTQSHICNKKTHIS